MVISTPNGAIDRPAQDGGDDSRPGPDGRRLNGTETMWVQWMRGRH